MDNSNRNPIHLSIIGQEPVSEGRFGCDYSWYCGYAAYRCRPARYIPGDDLSWAMAEAGYYNADCDVDPAVGEDVTGVAIVESLPDGTRSITEVGSDGSDVLIGCRFCSNLLIIDRTLTYWQIYRKHGWYFEHGHWSCIKCEKGIYRVVPIEVHISAFEIVSTLNLRTWRHVLATRTVKSIVHPQMFEVMNPLLREFKDRMPGMFDDIPDGEFPIPIRKRSELTRRIESCIECPCYSRQSNGISCIECPCYSRQSNGIDEFHSTS